MIDSHTHLASFKYKEGTPKECISPGFYMDLVNYMDTQRLEKVVLLALDPSIDYGRWIGVSRDVLEASRSDNRIIPFTLDPSDKDSYGIGEVKISFMDMNKSGFRIFKEAQRKDKPLLIHLEERNLREDSVFNHLGTVYDIPKLVSRYPKLKLILHGPGLWKYFGMNIVEKVMEYPNVYIDTSGGCALMGLRINKKYSREFMVKYRDKVLFGTDFPCLDGYSGYESQFGIDRQHEVLLKHTYDREEYMSLNLSDDVKDMIVERNIRNLLNI